MDGVAAGQVILDALNDEAHEVTAGRHQHRDEQVTLGNTHAAKVMSCRMNHSITDQSRCIR